MRTFSLSLFLFILTTVGCGELSEYSFSTEKVYHHTDNVRLDRSETSVVAGDRNVLVGSWDISQNEHDLFTLNKVHLRALVWYEREGWRRPADYDVETISPKCYDVNTTDEECYVLPRPELTVFQQAFELCWFESEGMRRRISPGFTFDTYGHVDVWGLLAPVVDRGSSMSLDLVCDIGDSPTMTFAVVPMWIEGAGRNDRYPSDSVTFYTVHEDGKQAVITVE